MLSMCLASLNTKPHPCFVCYIRSQQLKWAHVRDSRSACWAANTHALCHLCLQQLKQAHVRDERRLREAEERWKAEDTLRREREFKLQEEREREEMAAQLHEKRVQSAIKIQAAWRG